MNNEKIEQLAKEIRIKPGIIGKERILADAAEALERTASARALAARLSLWRKIMNSRITKFAVAAAVIIAAVFSVKIIGSSATPAYAFEQTVQANHTVRFLHIKDFDAAHSDEPKEFWVECDEAGRIKNLRSYFPEWSEPDDGAKIVVWSEGKAQVWFKKKNSLLTVRDEKASADMLKLVQECDPRMAVERLYEQEKQNKVKLEVNEPSDKTKNIKVTADSTSSGRREILYVDQATKLVTAMEFYQLKDGVYQLYGTEEFYDYNQPIDPAMFNLDKEVSSDATKIDQVNKEVGLAQGNLSNDEVEVEVAKQFFEALIAKDYAKAGKLLEGMPADKMEEMFGRIKFLRIVSIGKPAPHPIPATGGVVVPCIVEIEVNGKTGEQKFDRLGVRQVYNQPGRWTIFGGI
jgi:hypothetical protein